MYNLRVVIHVYYNAITRQYKVKRTRKKYCTDADYMHRINNQQARDEVNRVTNNRIRVNTLLSLKSLRCCESIDKFITRRGLRLDQFCDHLD